MRSIDSHDMCLAMFLIISIEELLLQLGLMINSILFLCKFEITFWRTFFIFIFYFFEKKSNTLNAYFHNSFVVSIQVKKNVFF